MFAVGISNNNYHYQNWHTYREVFWYGTLRRCIKKDLICVLTILHYRTTGINVIVWVSSVSEAQTKSGSTTCITGLTTASAIGQCVVRATVADNVVA